MPKTRDSITTYGAIRTPYPPEPFVMMTLAELMEGEMKPRPPPPSDLPPKRDAVEGDEFITPDNRHFHFTDGKWGEW